MDKFRPKKDKLITVFIIKFECIYIHINKMWKMWIKNKVPNNQIVMC